MTQQSVQQGKVLEKDVYIRETGAGRAVRPMTRRNRAGTLAEITLVQSSCFDVSWVAAARFTNVHPSYPKTKIPRVRFAYLGRRSQIRRRSLDRRRKCPSIFQEAFCS